MRRKFRIAFETLLWLLCFVNAAHAGPIGAAIGALAGALTAASGGIGALVTKLIVGIVLKIGTSLLAKALAPKRDNREPGIKGDIQVGGANPLSFLVGYIATAGQLEYINTWGNANKTPNAYLTLVISLSDLPISELTSDIWVNGQKCTIDFAHADATLGAPITQFADGGNNYAWVRFHDGTQTDADALLMSKFAADPTRPWSADMVGQGIAYVVLTFRLNRKFFTGIPQTRFVCKGIKQYIVAKDSTNGGSGLHRWDDPATWEYAEDNATCIYNVVRGVFFNDQWVYGGQNTPAALIPSASWIASYNECNVDMTLSGGGTEKQFRCGYEVIVSQEPLSVIERFLDGCNGQLPDIGGVYKLKVGAPSASVYSFTDADIVATEDLDFDPFPGLEQTFNGAQARYPEPGEAWELKDAPPYYNSTYEAADENRRLIAPLNLDTTFSNTQVQRLMKSKVEANRRFRRHVVVLPPDAALLEPAIDTVDWTSTREGYTAKDFIVTSVRIRAGMATIVQLLEIDNTDYNWTPATDQKPYSIGYVGTVNPPAQAAVGYSAQAYIIFDAAAQARRPTIAVNYPSDLDDVKNIRVDVRLKADASKVSTTVIDYVRGAAGGTTQSTLAAGPYLPATNYEVQITPIPFSGRDTNSTAWLTVLTDNVQFGSSDIAPGAIGITQFADGIAPVELLPAVPSNSDPANYEGRQVFNTTTGILWTYHSGAWTQTVASNVLDGSITTAKLADTAVTAAKLMDSAVTSLKIADAAVVANKIATGAVLEAKIADNAVSVNKILDGAIASNKIATGAVLEAKIADNAVTVNKIGAGAVTGPKILDGVISAIKIAAGAALVETFAVAPATGNFAGRMYFNSTDKKLYRYDGTAWVASVASVDVTGQLTDAQIAAIAAAKITGQISNVQIADAAVTAAKIADAAISTAKFASGIRPVEILSTLPTTGNFAGRIVFLTTDKKLYRYDGTAWVTSVASTDITGQLTDAQIAAIAAAKLTGQITTTQITDDAITTAKVAAGAITSNEIAANTIVAGDIAANAITSAAINAGAVTTAKLAAGAVTANELAANSVIAGKIAAGVVSATEIASGAITTAKIAAGAVTSNEIAANTIVAGDIAANAITSAAINANAVTTAKLAAGAVTSNEIAANTIVAGNIAAGAITATAIAAGAITTGKIAAGAITSNELAANSVIAGKIAAGVITSTEMAANSITTRELVMTNFVNQIPNGNFAAGFANWYPYSNASQIIIAASSAVPGGQAARFVGNDTQISMFSHGLHTDPTAGFDVQRNEQYYIRASFALVGSPSPLTVYVVWKLSDGTYTLQNFMTVQASDISGWTEKGATVTVPSNACKATLYIFWSLGATGTSWYIANVGAFKRNDANLIVDGAITANAIAANAVTTTALAANAVTAAKIAAGTITATEIASGAITTVKLAAGAVTATTIAANTITSGQIAAGTITATEIASGAITTVKLAAGAVTATTIATGAVTASAIAANTITGDKMVANAITTRELVMTSFINQIPNGNFAQGLANWTPYSSPAQISLASNTIYPGGTACVLRAAGTQVSMFSHGLHTDPTAGFDVKADEQYYIEASFAKSLTPSNLNVYACWKLTDGTYLLSLAFTVTAAEVTVSIYKKGATVTVPSNAIKGSLYFLYTGSDNGPGWYIMAVSTFKRNDANLIVDGAITTNALAANAVTAAKIAANTITAGQIAAGAISATQLASNAVTADKIAAGSITTAKLSTTDLQVGSAQIADAAITSHKVQMLEVGTL